MYARKHQESYLESVALINHVISFKVCVMTCNKESALFLMWTYWDRSHTWTPGCPFISPHISVMSAVPPVGNFTKHEPRSENLSLLYYCIMFQISLSVSVHLQWVILLNVVTVKWLFQPISFPPGINSSIRSVRVCECDTGELGHSLSVCVIGRELHLIKMKIHICMKRLRV